LLLEISTFETLVPLMHAPDEEVICMPVTVCPDVSVIGPEGVNEPIVGPTA
jgi:hypothetical protein